MRQRRSVTVGRRHCAAPVGGGGRARSRSFSSGWPCWLAWLSALTSPSRSCPQHLVNLPGEFARQAGTRVLVRHRGHVDQQPGVSPAQLHLGGGHHVPGGGRAVTPVTRRRPGQARQAARTARPRTGAAHDRRLPGAPGAYCVHGPDPRDNPRRDPRHLACRHGRRRDLRHAQDVFPHRADRDGRLHRRVARGQAPSPRLARRSRRGHLVRAAARRCPAGPETSGSRLGSLPGNRIIRGRSPGRG
jgi:hypothetical protein